MIVYKCFELHTHTLHSDGDFTLAELRERAGDFFYDAIAVTDHNTMSALDGLSPNPAEGVPVIPGIEWTTYYGHMVVLGAEEYIDWRFARPETIDEYTRAIKNVRGVIGIAHPFEFGSPLCTGCYWDFKVRDWENIDYIEVWSNPFPHGKLKNHLAFDWWTGLLNQGHRLAAAAGWDWHGTEEKPLPPATWLGLRDGRIDTAAVREALEAGRSFVTLGPFAGISLTGEDGQSYGLGETAAAGNYRLNIKVDENRRREIWAPFGIATKTIRLVQGGNVIESLSYSPGQAIPAVNLRLQPGWLRLEGYG
ncbi:MAG: CehA/McbA family metallohydrolase, partial [Treponema sp.]|nr:CehA/McbA family metallohydrolase [Treponema sp.]